MKKLLTLLCGPLMLSTSLAQTIEADFNKAFKDHVHYVGAMLQSFLDSPVPRDSAKMAVLLQIEPLMTNTSLLVTYEHMILQTNGNICKGTVADSIPIKLMFADANRAPVMYKPGSMVFVNSSFFRDMCDLYSYKPERIKDLYAQHMQEIKANTGGKRFDELGR